MITHGVKGSTLGETTLFGDHMVFRANGVGIGRRTAEHKEGRGGGLWKVEGGITKMLRSLKKGKRFRDSSDTRENLED